MAGFTGQHMGRCANRSNRRVEWNSRLVEPDGIGRRAGLSFKLIATCRTGRRTRRSPHATEAAAIRALEQLGWSSSELVIATSFWHRLRGMIARRPCVSWGTPLVIVFPGCRSVHTLFMGYPLDIAFADEHGELCELHRAVPAWRFLTCPGASIVLERRARVHCPGQM